MYCIQVTSLKQRGINYNSRQAFDIFYEFEIIKNTKMAVIFYLE